MHLRRAALALAFLAACAAPAAAQGARPLVLAQATQAPFEARLLRLAEILGSLHYLRNLCGEDSQEWRERMEALLEAEQPDAERRARFIAVFNRGYKSFETSYSTCTESAVAAIDLYLAEGRQLTRDTATRYGN